MRNFGTFILVLFLSNAAGAQGKAMEVLGLWLNEERDAKIEIYQSGDQFLGKLIGGDKLIHPNGSLRKDDKNPDSRLRSRPLVNLIIVSGLRYDGKEWTGGQIYDPKSGNTYRCSMKLDGQSLHLRGYKGISVLGRTTVWTRVQ